MTELPVPVLPTAGYPAGYDIRDISEQVRILHQLFPRVRTIEGSFDGGKLPKNAEGIFAIPRWEVIAPTYVGAVEKVLGLIAPQGKLVNYCPDPEAFKKLNQSPSAARAWKALGENQHDNDILMLPAQFGIRHRGRSVQSVRKSFTKGEFGLVAYAVGIMLLTHPQRFASALDLGIDCPGDIINLTESDGKRSSRAHTFYGPRYDFERVGETYDDFGSATGFVRLKFSKARSLIISEIRDNVKYIEII